jgi:hypothetical protein
MVLTPLQIEDLRRLIKVLLPAINAIEGYCEEDKEKKEEIEKAFKQLQELKKMIFPIVSDYSNFNKANEKLLEKIKEVKPILHDENTFKDFLQRVGFQGYKQTQIFRELKDEILYNFGPCMDYFIKQSAAFLIYIHSMLREERITYVKRNEEEIYDTLMISIKKISDFLKKLTSEYKERAKVLKEVVNCMLPVYWLIESIQKSDIDR